MQATENKATKNSRMKGFWKSFFKAFFITALVVLSTKIYETVVTTQDRSWLERKDTYGNQAEYSKLNWVLKARIFLSVKGLGKNNIIQKLLSEYSESLFLKAKARFPEGDIAFYDYLFLHKYAPIMYMHPVIITPFEKEELLDAMIQITQNKSNMDQFNKTLKFNLIESILYWFMYEAPKNISVGEGMKFRHVAHQAFKQINYKDFIQTTSSYYTPISIEIDLLKLDLAYVEATHCDRKGVNQLIADIEQLSKLTKIYLDLPLIETGKEVFLANVKTSHTIIENAKRKLSELCNVDIGK